MALRTHEKRVAYPAFQLLDLIAYCCLGHAQFLRSARKVLVPAGRFESANGSEWGKLRHQTYIHKASLWIKPIVLLAPNADTRHFAEVSKWRRTMIKSLKGEAETGFGAAAKAVVGGALTAVLSLTVGPSIALAAPNAESITRSVMVTYPTALLDSTAGRDMLRGKIGRAARKACDIDRSRGASLLVQAERNCVTKAIASANAQVAALASTQVSGAGDET